MNRQKTLTISIPTWNRASLLEELLIQLITQIEIYKLEDEIEIIVSDNFSSDNTESIVLKYCHKHSFLKYSKNNSNLGAKTNVIKSLYLANARFVLLLGDDDRIREDCLPEIISFLKSHPNTSILIDESKSKTQLSLSSPVSLDVLLTKFYWYMGNAGLFISSTKHLKYYIDNLGYNFFNECWPQSQLMILGNLIDNGEIYVKNINIPTISKHDEVMVYTSFYLWRTCVLELYNAANNLKSHIPKTTYDACRNFMQSNIKQVFLNILQCGLFVDLPIERNKTKIHIEMNKQLFSIHEKKYLSIIIFIFKLPTALSRPLSNIFILLFKGFSGLDKKNTFVKAELSKRKIIANSNLSVRKLDFEK